jgi:hypothetical protein
MNGRRFGLLAALLCVVAINGCNQSSGNNGLSNGNSYRACGSTTPAPATEVPPVHRSTAQACSPTSPDAMPIFTYNATGTPCTTDDQCTTDAGIRGSCLHGACSPDECLTDDDCAGGGVCVCSSPSGASGGGVVENMNYCARGGNCRVDNDCGAGGYCVPSAGVCGIVSGFYCHTPADTCVDPTTDCGASCLNACHYFPDKGRFACLDFIAGGC